MKNLKSIVKTKKPINSYKEALQTVLNENFSSLFGGATPVGGVSTNHSKGYVTGRSTPHGGRSMTGPTGFDITRINKEEELTSRAPALLPFPLDNVFENIVDSISSMRRVSDLMETAINNNVTLSVSKLNKLKKMQIDIENYIDEMTDIGKNIESISLSDM